MANSTKHDNEQSARGRQKSMPGHVDLLFRPLWWMNPIWVFLVLLPAIIIYANAASAQQYALWRVPKFLDNDAVSVMLLSILAMAIGFTLTGMTKTGKAPEKIEVPAGVLSTVHKLSNLCFVLLILSYFAWTTLAIQGGLNMSDIQAVLGFERGAVSGVKDSAAPVGGLTSFTQLGPAIVVFELILLRTRVRANRRIIYTVVILAALRALFYGERLALIEVLLPLGIICLALPLRTPSRIGSQLSQAAPIAAIPILWSIFAIFEYGRSWAAYRRTFDGSYAEFVTQRLSGYYATSINNSALFYERYPRLNSDPLYSFAAFWDAPFISSLMGTPEAAGIGVRTWWRWTLVAEANPEFNNPGTFAVTAAELGTGLALVYWLVLGLVLALIYRRFRMGTIFGLVALPVIFVGLVELPRIIYWMQGRFTPLVILLAVVALLVGTERRRPASLGRSPQSSESRSAIGG